MKGKLAGVGSIIIGAAVFAVLWMNDLFEFREAFVAFILGGIGIAMIMLIILGLMLLIWA